MNFLFLLATTERACVSVKAFLQQFSFNGSSSGFDLQPPSASACVAVCEFVSAVKKRIHSLVCLCSTVAFKLRREDTLTRYTKTHTKTHCTSIAIRPDLGHVGLLFVSFERSIKGLVLSKVKRFISLGAHKHTHTSRKHTITE